MQEGLQVVPSSALADQRAARSPLPLAVCPPTQLACAPTGEPVAPQIRERGARQEHRAAQGGLTSALPARRQQTREGRGRARSPAAARLSRALARAPPAGSQVAQSTSGSRPPGASAPPGASVLWAVRSGLALPSARLGGPLPALRPSPCSLRRASSAAAPSREGIPPFAVPPPNRPPFPGSAGKNGLERQAREFVAPSRTPLPAAGAQGWPPRARARSGPGRRPSALAPPVAPAPHPEQGLQFQASSLDA